MADAGMLSWMVPDPDGVELPSEADTVYRVGPPDTPVMPMLPESPDVAREKSLNDTPVTGLENVTVQWTVEALVGDGSTRLIESTVGGVLSITHE